MLSRFVFAVRGDANDIARSDGQTGSTIHRIVSCTTTRWPKLTGLNPLPRTIRPGVAEELHDFSAVIPFRVCPFGFGPVQGNKRFKNPLVVTKPPCSLSLVLIAAVISSPSACVGVTTIPTRSLSARPGFLEAKAAM